MRFTPQLERRVRRTLAHTPDACIVFPDEMYRADGSIMVYRDNLGIRLVRWLWLQEIGPIDGRLYLHRTCRTKGCQNPHHHEPSTRSARGRTARACPKGHEYTPANTLPVPSRRRCRQCRDDYNAKRRQPGSTPNGYCRSGQHKLTPANTYGPYANGRRRCRRCTLSYSRTHRKTKGTP